MRGLVFVFCTMIWAGGAAAQGWYEPARGTAERASLMDALRPYAEYVVGPPVQFIVYDLRVSGPLAFASVSGQRPGGFAIDPYQTPAFRRGEYDPEGGDLTGIQALFVRTAQGWIVTHWVWAATDVWWSDPDLCAQYRPVIADVCRGL